MTATQLDLFGALSKSIPRCKRFNFDIDASIKYAILSDSNIESFVNNDAQVFPSNGHMSFYKNALQSFDEVFDNAKCVVICTSQVDGRNKPYTNLSTFRSVIYSCKRIFPEARLCVLPCGEPPKGCEGISATNDFMRSKSPPQCTVLQTPRNFVSQGTIWNDETKFSMFEVIRHFLA